MIEDFIEFYRHTVYNYRYITQIMYPQFRFLGAQNIEQFLCSLPGHVYTVHVCSSRLHIKIGYEGIQYLLFLAALSVSCE